MDTACTRGRGRTPEQVSTWVSELKMGLEPSVAEEFKEAEIDGELLVQMDHESLVGAVLG